MAKVRKAAAILITVLMTFTLFSAAGVTGASAAGEPTYRAVLIGNNAYASNPLTGCINDATAIKETLQANAFDGGVGFSQVNLVPDANRQMLIDAINTTFADATSNDVSYFSYSGHGSRSGNTSYLCVLGASTLSNWISVDDLELLLRNVPGKVVIFLDSCYSGGFIDKNMTEEELEAEREAFNEGVISVFAAASRDYLTGDKYRVITASSKDQLSYETHNSSFGKTMGIFTAALCLGCGHPSGTRPADTNGDSRVTLTEAYNYTRTAVQNTLNSSGITQSVKAFPESSDDVLFQYTPGSSSLSLGISNWNPGAAAASTGVTVSSNVSWSVSSNASSWLTVSPSGGSDNGSFTAYATANTGAARTGTVTVTGGGQTRTVLVTQAAPAPGAITLALNTPASVAITAGGRREVRFTAPSAGTYVFESSNCGSLDPMAYVSASGSTYYDDDGGSGMNYLFQMTLSAGQLFTYYSGVYGGYYDDGSYTVTARPATPTGPAITLALNTPATVAITSGGRREVCFTAPSAGSYIFESSHCGSLDPKAYVAASGSSYYDDDGGSGMNYLFQTTLSAGQLFTYYSGAYGDSGSGSYSVTVSQEASIALSAASWNPGTAASSTSISVTSNVSWSVSSSAASWLTVSPSGGSDNGSFTIYAAENIDTSARTGTVTVTGGGITRTVAVTQAGRTPPAPPKGIFGTNAKWYGAWWHYILFFIGFGFIWMW